MKHEIASAMVVAVGIAKSGQVLDVFLKREQSGFADEMAGGWGCGRAG